MQRFSYLTVIPAGIALVTDAKLNNIVRRRKQCETMFVNEPFPNKRYHPKGMQLKSPRFSICKYFSSLLHPNTRRFIGSDLQVYFSCLVLFLIPSFALAIDFGSLVKSIKDGLQQRSPSVQQAPKSTQEPKATQTPTAQGNLGFGAKMTETYCKELFSIASISKKTPIDQSLVSEEFHLSPKDFFDAFMGALDANQGFTSYAFPSLAFYQNEFESDKVNVLFNLMLSYPSAQYTAALIAESRKTSNMPQYDHQAKIDATVALAIMHFGMQDKSKSPLRWKELVNALQHEEHYTSYVLRARLMKSGETGPVDLQRAVDLLLNANGLRNKYQEEQHLRSMSARNYQTLSNQTLYEILAANPAQAKRGFLPQFMQQYSSIKNSPNLAPELQAKLGPPLQLIEQASSSAAQKAGSMLNRATDASRLKAEKAALDSSLKTRTSDSESINIDARAMASLARELEKVNKLDEEQKKQFAGALKDAHESGDRAIGMMPTMITTMMNLILQRGIGAAPAIIPYAKKFQAYSDNACTVVSRWDQAAHVTQTPIDQDPESRTNLSALVAEGL